MATITPQELQTKVGEHLGTSDWVLVDQDMINKFADATGDHQFIHIDEEKAKLTPFGGTIAHGFLTLSLLPAMGMAAFEIEGLRMSVNYGLDRVRFPAPVRAGSRLRGRFVLREYQPIEGGAQLVVECTMEIEGGAKPACVALAVSRRFV